MGLKIKTKINFTYLQIPLDLIQQMNTITNLTQFIEQFVDMSSMDDAEKVSCKPHKIYYSFKYVPDGFCLNFFFNKNLFPFIYILARIRGDEDVVEKSVGLKPEFAVCMPTMQVVSLSPADGSNDPSIMYYPKCTRILQCGGCCLSNQLTCTPTETVTKIFEVNTSDRFCFTQFIRLSLYRFLCMNMWRQRMARKCNS